MRLEFENNCYSSVFEKNNLINGATIQDITRKELLFRYDHTPIKYVDFCQEYENHLHDSGHSIQNLLEALKSMIQLISHIAKAIFIGIPLLIYKQPNYFKAYCFYSVRDGQEIFGRIASSFQKKYGLYHIQASQFHQTCYTRFLYYKLGHPEANKTSVSSNLSSS